MKHQIVPGKELAICSVCGAGEAELTKECVGRTMTAIELALVSEGLLNYEGSLWHLESLNSLTKELTLKSYYESVVDNVIKRTDQETIGDNVNHPKHYTMGKYEVIDVLEDWELEYHEGNVVKYVARAKHKHNRLEDLQKAAWYLNRKIQLLKTLHDEQEEGE